MPSGSGTLIGKKPSGRAVAVTGAASFLGANLIGLLEEDPRIARIVAVDVKPPSTAQRKTRFYEVDFTGASAEARLVELLGAEQADTLVHLAFMSSPTHATAHAHELESVGTRHVLVAARHANVRKVVAWSQTLLYGANPSNPNYLTEKHPLRAPSSEPWFADKLEAETELARFADRSPATIVTVLRTAPILGPTVRSYLTRWLARRLVPVAMGFDPLVQFLHEVDAIAAFKLAIDRDHPGVYNIVGDGVLPLSTVIKLAGRLPLPVPHPLVSTVGAALWLAQLVDAPPSFMHYLRFLCVADGAKAREKLGFRPAYTTREAVLDFTNAQRLRDVKLLHEAV
ncbi:MAG: NAD-dependent epimerase/dehydratase family protein [Labilithrix sp.]|nr:NAD-dependent epimerase/dehydratase family protein [Labilithrix sp.]MCW5814056.1 NAD-dependent epimerase/dehydratase family protein [Labilithrix sp.]